MAAAAKQGNKWNHTALITQTCRFLSLHFPHPVGQAADYTAVP